MGFRGPDFSCILDDGQDLGNGTGGITKIEGCRKLGLLRVRQLSPWKRLGREWAGQREGGQFVVTQPGTELSG